MGDRLLSSVPDRRTLVLDYLDFLTCTDDVVGSVLGVGGVSAWTEWEVYKCDFANRAFQWARD